MKNSSGFSLLELLIVIAMLGIISAIAVPSLIASRRAANETSALAELKSFMNADHEYFSVYGSFTSPNNLYINGFVTDDFGTRLKLSATIAGSGGNGGGGNGGGGGGGGEGEGEGEEGGGGGGTPCTGDCGGPAADGIPANGKAFRIVFAKSGYYFVMIPIDVSVVIDTLGQPKFDIVELYMIAVPQSYSNGGFYQTGTKAFYADSLTNIPWSVRNYPKKIDCLDSSGKPNYEQCLPAAK
jgi:prepilin-type N-terminal cleavage/methylation domain-containing protein